MSIIKCHISGVRYQVSSDNMSSTGVRYQVSNNMSSTGDRYQVSSITCQVPVSDIKCQRSGVKYNISVPVSNIKCQRSGVKYNISVSTSYINSYSDVSCNKSHNSNY